MHIFAHSKMNSMGATNKLNYVKNILDNMPNDWLKLTTHRLDIYDESRAKVQFTEQLEVLFAAADARMPSLAALPTAYDYIRLGHPLSCLLEWAMADRYQLPHGQVISFSSQTMPILAVLRANLLQRKKTRVVVQGKLPNTFDIDVVREVYGYNFDLVQANASETLPAFEGSTILVSDGDMHDTTTYTQFAQGVDFWVNNVAGRGSVLLVSDASYVSDIQHVRRRETIAMTPANCLAVLQAMVKGAAVAPLDNSPADKARTRHYIKEITGAPTDALVGSSGLSVQYAIMMGVVHYANQNHRGKDIKFVVPTNCYGGTNDQARRVAACMDHVEVVDLAVDGDSNMVQSIDAVLDTIAAADAVPFIIAEIPTNPRVEVPDLEALKAVLAKERKTAAGAIAIDPVFILDQTFCPNVRFLGEGEILSTVRALSYASGSKFPSGGKCTAGYVVGNALTVELMQHIRQHLSLCDNEATALQYVLLAEQLPSMNKRIAAAYMHTRSFVNFIAQALPTAKINFVSEQLAERGFTPSVFSLDLPTKGETEEEKEAYKRKLNHKLITMMITQIPQESKYCVSYGQLQGCYWTIPATSTQGTTKEGDKDYIARVALSGNMDLAKHQAVFAQFVKEIE